jgi:hypothetical protein
MYEKIFPAFLIIAFCAVFASAQLLADPEDNQSWNDVQLTVPLNKAFDFSALVTMRFGKNATRLNDGRFAIGVAWKATKSLTILPFYWNIQMRNARRQFRQEHRLALRATYRFPIKSFGLIHRSQYEYRMRAVNSWRYRAALTFEKDLPEKFIPKAKFFFTGEVFYDSLLKKFSRDRFQIGINKTLNKNLSVDVSYMRQNDGFARPGDLNVIWVTWRVKL